LRWELVPITAQIETLKASEALPEERTLVIYCGELHCIIESRLSSRLMDQRLYLKRGLFFLLNISRSQSIRNHNYEFRKHFGVWEATKGL
jgi:hypothetical protein